MFKLILFSLLLFCNALFGEKIIRFNEGRIMLDSPIVITESNIIIEGHPSTMLKLANGSNCPMIIIGNIDSSVPVSGVIIRNLFLDGNKDNQNSEYFKPLPFLRNNCITIRNCTNILLENITVCNASSGGVVIEKQSSSIIINGLNSYDNAFDGFCIYESTGCLITNSHLHSNAYAGISLDWKANNNKFMNITLDRNLHAGIFMRDSNNNVFLNLMFKHSGIYIHQRDDEENTGCSNNYFWNFNNIPVFIGSKSCEGNMFKLTE